MKKLFLHIGYPKTGTTSIQKALYDSKKNLSLKDVELFCETPSGLIDKTGNASDWVPFDSDNIFDRKIVDIDLLINKLSNSDSQCLIFSAESFYSISNIEEIKQLKEKLNNKFDVTVIIYIRRQDKLALSLHQQMSKKYKVTYYGNKALPEFDTLHAKDILNYEAKITYWESCFGADNIIVRVFDKESLFKGDVVQDFLKVVGLSSINIKPIKLNSSNGFERTKVGHLIGQTIDCPIVSELLRNNTDNSGKLLPTKIEAERFYQYYKESNTRLNKKYKINSKHVAIFDDDFSMYPDNSADVWTEERANQAILNILLSVNKLPLFKLFLSRIRLNVKSFLPKEAVDLIKLFKSRLSNT